MPADPFPIVNFATAAAWNDWLGKEHAACRGVWLKLAKRTSSVPSVTYAEALECALCHGWIDGTKKKLDEDCWLQMFTPRKNGSLWSKVNRGKALDFMERGLMQPGGHAAIERAKASGRWETAYEPQSKAEVPPDLAAALGERPQAAAFFATLSGQNRYAILFRLQTAKKSETRAARLVKFVGMLERGETLH